MYNRYIPQSDGSHKRRSIPDPPQPPCAPPPPEPEECSTPPCPSEPPRPMPKPSCNNQTSIPNFFRQLLPKDLDTADLLILILLLLMAGDREDQRNNALLTLALYFFL